MLTGWQFLRSKKGMAILLLIAIFVLAYAPATNFPFVNFDDNEYVTDVPQIQQGLSWDSFMWAMTTMEAAFWHPLTWLSHILAYQLFGLNPVGHHLTSLLLHLANVLLLFGVLHQMTGAVWRSALVAALFALHPLNVESVAWVAERKNVLSTLFWLLTMAAYVGYVRKPVWQRYVGMMGIFVLGLMAKPMLVTLPCVLLLLDYWPLGRLGKEWREFSNAAAQVGGREATAVYSCGSGQRASDSGAVTGWSPLLLGRAAAGNSSGQRRSVLWALSQKDGVADGSGGFLSPSGQLMGDRVGGFGGSAARRNFAGSMVARSKLSLSGGGMALVCGDAVSGERSHSGRQPRHG